MNDDSILAETIAANVERCREKLNVKLWQDFGIRKTTWNEKIIITSFHASCILRTGNESYESCTIIFERTGQRQSHHLCRSDILKSILSELLQASSCFVAIFKAEMDVSMIK